MSRKTISFQNPPKDLAAGSSPKKRTPARSRKAAAIDEWVQETEQTVQDDMSLAGEAGLTVEAREAPPNTAAISIEPVAAGEAFAASKVAPQICAAPQAVFSLSAQPDPFEAFKVVFMLPSLACFYWSFGAAQKNMSFWAR